VDAPQLHQLTVLERLRADGEAVDARGHEALEQPLVHRAGVGLERDLGAVHQARGARAGDDPRHRLGGPQRRRAAPEVQRAERPARLVRTRAIGQLPEDGVGVAVIVVRQHVAVEVAVRALLLAVREVHVEADIVRVDGRGHARGVVGRVERG
jgi:hypothetical protein